jgi:hypothetical protein
MGKVVAAGCMVLFGLAFTGFAVFWMAMAWFTGAPWYFLLFGVPFVVIGPGILGAGAWGLIVRPALVGMAFGPATVQLSPPTVHPGETVRVRYEQAARRNLEVRRVLIRLVLQEHATYRRGTNTYTALHDRPVDQYEAPGRALTAGQLLTEECTLRVPVDGMHSLNAPRNKLRWLVRIEIDTPAAPDVREETEFSVMPDVAAGAS